MDNSFQRFELAQSNEYESALRELHAGAKYGHWMWFIFPQLRGLGQSETARYYGIADLDEARNYLRHPVLGPRLIECTRAVLAQVYPVLDRIFPPPDDLKFGSCMTLFSLPDDAPAEFQEAIDKFLNGKRDDMTLKLLQSRDTK